MKPAPCVIRTSRLTLRPFRASDREPLRRLLERVDIHALFDTSGRRISPTSLAEKMLRDAGRPRTRGSFRLCLAILPRGGRLPVGGALLDCDSAGSATIGLWLSPEWRGKGLGREALDGLIRHGFETGACARITGMCNPGNHASIRLMEACGMRLDSRLKSEDDQGQPVDRIVFALSKRP
jgi:ribosomal-protein-alanine N-acetyltransferase